MPLTRIGVVARRSYEGLGPALDRVRLFAASRGADVRYEESTLPHAPEGSLPLLLDEEPVDVVLALGGDGTLLRASRLTVGRDIPVLGVNVGHLGFLTAAGEDELETALDRLAMGNFELDRRFTLEATVISDEGRFVDGGFFALNDFVIHKGGAARVTRLDLYVGHEGQEEEIGSFSADGVIVSTPTGSTAYSMSAGGPIVVPSVECITITAICPHTLAVRPLVVPTDARIRIRALDRPQDLVLTADGQVAARLTPGDSVVVERGARGILMVRFSGQTFFSTLRRKLNWAIRAQERI
ncbi:MAG TPA: NAD(+)/NADH kinase [Longimicrobiales bacterium]